MYENSNQVKYYKIQIATDMQKQMKKGKMTYLHFMKIVELAYKVLRNTASRT